MSRAANVRRGDGERLAVARGDVDPFRKLVPVVAGVDALCWTYEVPWDNSVWQFEKNCDGVDTVAPNESGQGPPGAVVGNLVKPVARV